MTLSELGARLASMYEMAPKGEKVTMIHLFGVKYHTHIRQFTIREVVTQAGISSAYATELNKAINLAKYVIPKASLLK